MNHSQKLGARNQVTGAGAFGLALVILWTTGVGFAATAAKSSPEATATAVLSDFVASLEGAWVGDHNDTPFGKMPFAVLFEWAEDGSLHSRSSLNRDTYIDLRFERTDDGTWMLHEEAAMEGLGLQTYGLIPSPEHSEDEFHRWIWKQDPEFLSIDVGLIGETMSLDVLLRGQPHVAFRLDKQPPEAWAEMKRQMLAQAEQAPDEGTSIREVVSNPPERLEAAVSASTAPTHPTDPVESARQDVAGAPDNAHAHLALARLLGAAINEDPANGPRYAFEMLSALQTAVALDNQLAEAYHYLVGYYLNAPPIAGGSLEKAEAAARSLAEFDPEGSEQLLSQIAARRERRTAGGNGR